MKTILCLLMLPGLLFGAPAPQTKPQPNTVPDLLLPPEEHWNCFEPDRIPDFAVPTRFDPVLGTNFPVKFLIWHNLGRGLFRTVTDGTEKAMFDSERVAMLNKGVGLLAYDKMRTTIEHVPHGGMITNSDRMPLNPLTQVVVGQGCGNDREFKDDWNKWVEWWRWNVDSSAGPLAAVRPGKPSPICMTFTDYEATYAWGNSQDDANHLVTGMYAMLERTTGYAGQMYLGPLNTCGGLPEDVYQGGSKTIAWFSPTDDSVPEAYRGRKLEGNPRIVAGFEVSHYMETFLPEGFQAMDQKGEDFFVVTHFGKAPTAEHWAARVGGLTEGSYQYTKPAGQRLIAQLKVVCDRQSGYQYGREEGRERWIQQYGRYANLLSGPDHTEYPSTIGTEPVSNFAAEAQMLLACFSGADGVNFWGAGPHDPRPRPRAGNPQRGEKHDDPDYANVDFEPLNYTLKAFWRMAQKATLEDGRKVAFYDICDGTEEYLNWTGEVSYDGGRTFAGTRAIDWQYGKKTAVRMVVNKKKKVLFVLAFQPYGVEQDEVSIRYGSGARKLQKKIKVPKGKVVIQAFALKHA